MTARLVAVEEGGRRLEAVVVRAGDDLVVVVRGGSGPHVGAVVLALPVPSRGRVGSWRASSSLLTVGSHREEPIARGVAESLCEALGCTVVATAGVHEDGLDAAGVAAWLRLGERLGSRLVEELTAADGG